jgi:hypothetical protein
MKRSGPIKRYTPVRKKRPGTRRGQPTPEEVKAVRLAVFERAKGKCELNLIPECIKGVLPFEGDSPWDHGHLVHIHAKRRFGTTVDGCKWGCWKCHLVGVHQKGLKPNES